MISFSSINYLTFRPVLWNVIIGVWANEITNKIPQHFRTQARIWKQHDELNISCSSIYRRNHKHDPGTEKFCSRSWWHYSWDIIKIVFTVDHIPIGVHFESVFITRCFPDELKIANVIPQYKVDDRMCFNNDRPVSLLCILSKVFETVMYIRLISLLEFNKVLIENQFGFRKKCSNYMALAVLIDEVIKSLENGDYMRGVFLDF